jgi:DNA ligase (NAD+)
MAEKSATNLLAAIEASKEQPLSRFLFALGIRHVGETVARDLARHFATLDRVLAATVEDFEAVSGVGPQVAEAMAEFTGDPENQKVIARLRAAGVAPASEKVARTSSELAGKTFVFTGTLATMTREDAEREVIARGARAAGSVSRATDFVVAGEGAGSKAARARELGIAILNEDEFRALLAGGA